MPEKYKTSLKDWYEYHKLCAQQLKDKPALDLLQKTLLAEHEYWIDELAKELEIKKDGK